MKKILLTQVKIESDRVYIVVTAHIATLYKTIEAVATRTFKHDKNIRSYWLGKGKPQMEKHGIVKSEETNIPGYSSFHCLFTLAEKK